MAATTSKAARESVKNSGAVSLLFWLLVTAQVLARPLVDPGVPNEASLASKGRGLLADDLSTVNKLHPRESTSSASLSASSAAAANNYTTERQFQAAAHEVPSGPNPESNK